jgi:hypothetical protein
MRLFFYTKPKQPAKSSHSPLELYNEIRSSPPLAARKAIGINAWTRPLHNSPLGGFQRLLDVGNDVVDTLDAYRQANEIGRNAR